MDEIIHFGLNPPDNSGNWVKGFGGAWLPKSLDTNTFTVPSGFTNDSFFPGLLSPNVISDTLTSFQVNDIIQTKAIVASTTNDKNVGDFLNKLLTFGSQFVDLAIKAKVLIDPSKGVTYDNIDKSALEYSNKVGTFDKTYISKGSGSSSNNGSGNNSNNSNTGNLPLNSTFLGINFNNPLTLVVVFSLVVLIVLLLVPSNHSKD